jgi:hypothetical protein
VVFTLALVFAIPTQAACLFCDDVVEVNDVRAKCYLSIYEEALSELASGTRSYVKVNIGSCEGLTPEDERGTIRDFPLGPTKFVYSLDEARIVCLRQWLEQRDAVKASFSPLTTVDLNAECPLQ